MLQLLAQELFFFLCVVVRDANQGLVARLTQRFLDGLQHVHKQVVRQHRNQHRDVVAVARGEGACCGVRCVAQLLRRGFDAFGQIAGHGPFSAQCTRYRDRADLSQSRHIGQRDAACGA